jgi:hypothetical protein
MTPNYGDVPTWLATLGAGVAAYFAYGAYRIESARDERQNDLMERDQASRVGVWPEQRDNPETGHPGEAEWIWLRNASELPIHEVRLYSYAFIHPDTNTVSPDSVYELGTVGPSDAPLGRLVRIATRESYVYAVEFRDAAGATWHRDRNGVLAKGAVDDTPFEANYLPNWWDA